MIGHFIELYRSINAVIPDDIYQLDSDSMNGAWIQPPIPVFQENEVRIETRLLLESAILLKLPFLEGVSLSLGGDGTYTIIPLNATVHPNFRAHVGPIPINAIVENDSLQPVHSVPSSDGSGRKLFDVIDDGKLIIGLGNFALGFDLDGLYFDAEARGELPPAMIGESGFVIEASGVIPVFSDLPPGTLPNTVPSHARGLFIESATLHLPPDIEIPLPTNVKLDDFFIGTGGISGKVTGSWVAQLNPQGTEYIGDGAGKVFGIPFSLRSIDITFAQSVPINASLAGELILPFFDGPVELDLSVGFDGQISAGLARIDADGNPSTAGLVTVEKDGILSLTLDSLDFDVDDGVAKVSLSGSVKPLFGGFDWPTFDIEELSIDSEGNIEFDGGWLDLRQGYTLNFYGFQLEVTQLGFGNTDDGGKWIGFSGTLKLVEGLSASSSVEGLRITWYPDDSGRQTKISFNGAGVELAIPDVLSFKGEVSFREFEQNGEVVQRFDGNIAVNLVFLQMEVDGQLVIGVSDGDPYMAIYLDLELPAGIPIGTTGLALFGFSGLAAMQMAPNKTEEEAWYSIERPDWFHRDEPGVTDLAKKWSYRSEAFAIGAGVTLGTQSDNGYTFSSKVLLVVSLPGPIIMLDGRANLLKERSKLSEEPAFHALALLDARVGDVIFGVDADYSYDSKGSIIDIAASAEAFFNVNDPTAWHIYIGKKTPVPLRTRADIFKLFQAQGWFMVDNTAIDTGMWVGWRWEGDFEIVSITINAWIEGGAQLSYRPLQFDGYLNLYGSLGASAFGFGFSLIVEAGIEAQIDKPASLVAHFRFSLDLPWPLDDVSVSFDLRLGDSNEDWPELPLPVQEVTIEHLRSTQTWPLRREAVGEHEVPLLRPNFDYGGGTRTRAGANPTFLEKELVEPTDSEIPVIPIDGRPHITFNRSVHDDALVSVNPTAPKPEYEIIGDPVANKGSTTARFSVKRIVLSKRVGDDWLLVAKADGSPNENDPIPRLFGSWAPEPALGGGQLESGEENVPTGNAKLLLWSKNPFHYTRRTYGRWDAWFNNEFQQYPCPRTDDTEWLTYSFESFPEGELPENDMSEVFFPWNEGSPFKGWRYPLYQHIGSKLLFLPEPPPDATELPPIDSFSIGSASAEQEPRSALLFNSDSLSGIYIFWSFAATRAQVTTSSSAPIFIRMLVNDGGPSGGFHWPSQTIEIEEGRYITTEIDLAHFQEFSSAQKSIGLWLRISTSNSLYIHKLELLPRPYREVLTTHIEESLLHYSDETITFDPNTSYRIEIQTEIEAVLKNKNTVQKIHNISQTEYAYFRTAGPPGLANLNLPSGALPTVTNTLNRGESPEDNTLQLIDIDGNPRTKPVLKCELNDLSIFVSQTIPPTLPETPGEPKIRYRPFYRAYDIGVEFNEDYISSIYRRSQRDLTLQLYDSNERIPRNAEGILANFNDAWDQIELPLEASDTSWYNAIELSPCLTAEQIGYRKADRIQYQDITLAPNATYEARILPLLFAENFSGYETDQTAIGHNQYLGDWQVIERGGSDTAHWQVGSYGAPVSYYIKQTSEIRSLPTKHKSLLTSFVARMPVLRSIFSLSTLDKPSKVEAVQNLGSFGTELALKPQNVSEKQLNHPANWNNYRIQLKINTGNEGWAGLVFRRKSDQEYYRYSFGYGVQRLVYRNKNNHFLLREAPAEIVAGVDQQLMIEAVAQDIKVFLNNTVVFSVKHNQISSGGIGLYTAANPDAKFSEIRIEDLRVHVNPLFQFSFTTSCYANFYHHIHSFDDDPIPIELSTEIASSQPLGLALPNTEPEPPSEEEQRAFKNLLDSHAEISMLHNREVNKIEIYSLWFNSKISAFLLRSPEPLDWARLTLEISSAKQFINRTTIDAGTLKITNIVRAGEDGIDADRLSILLRGKTDISGYKVEIRALPLFFGPILEQSELLGPIPRTSGVANRNGRVASGSIRKPLEQRSRLINSGTIPTLIDYKWKLYKQFEKDEELYSDGSVLCIARGNTNFYEAPTGHKILSASPESTVMPLGALECRIIDAEGNIVHQKQFLRSNDFQTRATKVLRNNDGTNTLIIPSTETGFPTGIYRFTFRYFCVAKGQTTFSRNGDTRDEEAHIDFNLSSSI